MTEVNRETPVKVRVTEQGLVSGVKLIKGPKVTEFVPFSDQCLEEITKPVTRPRDTVPIYSQLHCSKNLHKSELCICVYLLGHTALTNKLNYQNK